MILEENNIYPFPFNLYSPNQSNILTSGYLKIQTCIGNKEK